MTNYPFSPFIFFSILGSLFIIKNKKKKFFFLLNFFVWSSPMNRIHLKKLSHFVDNLQVSPIFWKTSQVIDWFENILQMPEYVEILSKKKINGKKLIKLIYENNLLKLKITKLGHKKLIEQQMKKMISKFPNMNKKVQFANRRFSDDAKNNKEGTNEFKYISKTKKVKRSLQTLIEIQNQMSENKILPSESFEKIVRWDTKELNDWLIKIGFEQFIDTFNKNSIRGDILFDLREEHMR